ncbi:thioredoxin-domain-containing protein [Hesseltinella vesiculosa]|uniref:protein disulfide-isomerase n=1 Tax=Hesseltinella vesiculosa TaxID=101127 RepID=A0A1X2GCX9_9FUNG|nr:thioredoxin-domain-containing protein [Hesseltinella vesiculosa]
MLGLKAGLLLSVALACVDALYDSRDAVVELNPSNFKSEVLDNDKLVAVEFYAPWCGHCKNLAPEWKKAAKNMKNLVTMAAINCDEDQNRPLCGEYGIQGFPTLKLFRPRFTKEGKRVKKPSEYQGPRDAKNIVDYMLSMQPTNIRLIKGDPSRVKSKASMTIDDFLGTDNATLPKALLFTDKSSSPALYKALSVEFPKNRMLFGEVKKVEKEVMAQFGVTDLPTLMVLPPGQDALVYEGKLKYTPLHEYFSEHALAPTSSSSSSAKPTQSAAPPKPAKQDVQALTTTEQLQEMCPASANVICAIALLSEEEREQGIQLLNELNEKDKNDGLFRYGWIASDNASGLIQALDLMQDFPSLFILHNSKQLYRPFVGAWDEPSLSRWLSQIATGRVAAWPYTGPLEISTSEEPSQDHVRDEL